MKRVLWTLALVLAATAASADEWKSIFNGKDLSGWHAVGDGEWVVEQGAIVGKTQQAAKLYGLLVSDEKHGDFALRFQFKSVQGNSGFYPRARIETPDRAVGLQVEVDPQNATGGIYESYGRGWVDKPADEEVNKYFKRGEWNEMVVEAQGATITVRVNGVEAAKFTDEKMPREGHLAFQMHAGNAMLVMFKDIAIRTAK